MAVVSLAAAAEVGDSICSNSCVTVNPAVMLRVSGQPSAFDQRMPHQTPRATMPDDHPTPRTHWFRHFTVIGSGPDQFGLE